MENVKRFKVFYNFIHILAIIFMACFLCGCASLSYSGEDYNSGNIQTIKTNEDFVFNIYKKSIDNANIKIGISKTPVYEILALYVQVENLSYETPYVFKVEDLTVADSQKELPFINSDNYLSIYQTQEASSMSAMSSVGASLSNMAGLNTNYNEYNQSMIQNSSNESSKSAFSALEAKGNQISKHSIRHSSTISPRKSQYYYFFIENTEHFPINIKYKNLSYQFNL